MKANPRPSSAMDGMQTLYDYKRFAILYVDDEEKSLKAFARLFGEQLRVLEFFIVQRERDELVQAKRSGLHMLLIADRVISLGVLAAGLSHHVRNALVAVRTFIVLASGMLYREDLDMEALRYPNFWTDF